MWSPWTEVTAVGSRRAYRLKNKPRVPLERALSKLGLASRNQARTLIESGQVKVHGRIQTNPLFPVTPETAAIEIHGKRAQKQERLVIAFHKPKGVVTTRQDEKGRKTVFDVLPPQYSGTNGLHCVGRLDLATTGLLLLTNDTRLSAWLTDPEVGVSRLYLVIVRGDLTNAERHRMVSGIETEVGLLAAQSVTVRKRSGKESHLSIELTEGKNREIRRLCKAVGHEVTSLKRLAYGEIKLGDLQPGEARVISESELQAAFPTRPHSTTLDAPTSPEWDPA